jgi:hypothetical protein
MNTQQYFYYGMRSEWTRAQLFLLRCAQIARETGGYEISGYWDDLNYSSSKCWDSLAMLKKHIVPEYYEKIQALLAVDDEAMANKKRHTPEDE